MYIPPAFLETDLLTLHDFIEHNSFGLLVSQVDGSPFATHLPFLLERESGRFGTLVGHTALANPQCRQAGEQSVLSIFSGPHVYVSPTWYAAENVVPTWNYVAVHCLGKLRIIDDPKTLKNIVSRTTEFYERAMPVPWSFDGSPTFAERMLSQIVGFRMEIESIEGKWKLNQNHSTERQQKVISSLQAKPDANSQAVAKLMQSRTGVSGR